MLRLVASPLNALGDWHDKVTWGPHDQKVDQYLKGATKEIVLRDLLLSLKQTVTRRRVDTSHLESIFDRYCYGGTAEEKHWTQDSFQKYLNDTNPLLLHGGYILWRCFSFYAFHPFSEFMSGKTIDWEAFQRAALLLGMRGVDRLGVMNDEILWVQDWDTIYMSNFRRIFRSIGTWEARNEKSLDQKLAYKESIEETTNVLAMVQPFQELRPPREDWLKETACRLLEHCTEVRCLTLVEDLTRLMKLLLQLRVHEGKPPQRLDSSVFYSVDTVEDNLADKMTEQFGKPLEELTYDRIRKVIKEFPNIWIYFNQLWEALFQPLGPMSDGLEYHSINGISDHLIGALSLMIPYQSRSKWIEIEDKKRQLVTRKLHFWTKIEDLNGDLDDFEPLSLAEVLRYNSPSLILITGKDKRTSKAGVMGVYLPASQFSCSKNRHEYIFFTLLPRFCVKRWTGIQRSIFDIIKTDIAGFSVDRISSEQAFETKQPFWIGNPEKDETYIRIDLLQSRASLITKPEYQKSYDDDNDAESTAISHTSSEMSEILLDAVKTFQIGRIMPGSHSSTMKNEKKDLNQNTDKIEEVIRGEELKKRIYGFGRNSLPQDLQ